MFGCSGLNVGWQGATNCRQTQVGAGSSPLGIKASFFGIVAPDCTRQSTLAN